MSGYIETRGSPTWLEVFEVLRNPISVVPDIVYGRSSSSCSNSSIPGCRWTSSRHKNGGVVCMSDYSGHRARNTWLAYLA